MYIAAALTVRIVQSKFSHSRAASLGGALYLSQTNSSIQGSHFSRGHSYMGGAICSLGGGLRLQDSTFFYNSADYGGGILWACKNTKGGCSQTLFENNTIRFGPGMDPGAILNPNHMPECSLDLPFRYNKALAGAAVFEARTPNPAINLSEL